jgi:GT2 family glycosyltransferase
MTLTLSVVVVALNEASHLPRLARALHALRRPEGMAWQSVLVDGGSDDGTPARARELGFDAVIECPGASIPAGRNAGLRAATGELVAFLDADCEPAADWLEQAAGNLDPAQPAVLAWPAEPPPDAGWIARAWHAHHVARIATRQAGPRGTGVARRAVTTRNLVATRAAFDRAGDFDESLPVGEDSEWARRAQARGVELRALPALRVVHHGEASTLCAFFRQQRWHARRAAYSRHGSPALPLAVGVFAATLLTFVAAPLAVGATGCPAWGLLAAPLPLLLLAAAVGQAVRLRDGRWIPAWMALYFFYGLARTLDLLGVPAPGRNWRQSRR